MLSRHRQPSRAASHKVSKLLLRSFHVLRRHGPVFAALLSHAMAISSDGVVQDTAVQNFVRPDPRPSQ